MTDQQIADFLATEVMGWRRLSPAVGYRNAWIEDHATPGESIHTHYDPTTDLNQAVQAAEKTKTENSWAWGIRSGTEPIYSPVGGSTCYRKGYYAHCRVTETFSTISPADALSRAVVKAAGGDDA